MPAVTEAWSSEASAEAASAHHASTTEAASSAHAATTTAKSTAFTDHVCIVVHGRSPFSLRLARSTRTPSRCPGTPAHAFVFDGKSSLVALLQRRDELWVRTARDGGLETLVDRGGSDALR